MNTNEISHTSSLSGWLLDVYPNEMNLTVWLIGEDGQRHRFVQDFTASLYAAGPAPRLRQLWSWLTSTYPVPDGTSVPAASVAQARRGGTGAGKQQPVLVRLRRTERQDVFHDTASATLPQRGGCVAETADSTGMIHDGGLSHGKASPL